MGSFSLGVILFAPGLASVGRFFSFNVDLSSFKRFPKVDNN